MKWKWKCESCHIYGIAEAQDLPSGCPKCGQRIILEQQENGSAQNIDYEKIKSTTDRFIRDTLSLEKVEGFRFSNFLGQLFKHHPWHEIEDYMSFGTSKQTPDLARIEPVWPSPWLFFRMILITVLAVLFLYWQADLFQIYIVMPLLIFGVIGIPLATLLFFWEVNIPKNISILLLIRIMLISGFLSIAITLGMHKFLNIDSGPIWAGPVEETAKLLTMLFFVRNKKYCYKLNGLLIGAAVGAGFAFIETGGYVLRHGDSTMILRALLAPFGHIPYSAIIGFALWRVAKKTNFNISDLFTRKFIPLFITSILLHMFWNSPILKQELIIKAAIVGIIEYTIIIYLIQEGINEIRSLKSNSSQPGTPADDGPVIVLNTSQVNDPKPD